MYICILRLVEFRINDNHALFNNDLSLQITTKQYIINGVTSRDIKILHHFRNGLSWVKNLKLVRTRGF